MVDIIQNNPYRLLGVFSNSPKKELVANQGKMKAFLRTGKTVTFPLDLEGLLPPVDRNEETVEKAKSLVELPQEQLKYALFWFVKRTPLDDIAFNHLYANDITSAMAIWQKKESVSSLQNLLVCALIQNNYKEIAFLADKIFTQYAPDFCQIINETLKADKKDLTELFINALSTEKNFDLSLLGTSDVPAWNEYIKGKLVAPVLSEINAAIETARKSRNKGPEANYNAGKKLMTTVQHLLFHYQELVSITDMQYQIMADKLANEILQYGIDYYNDSTDDDAALKALPLQKYALQIAAGCMAKERCKENVEILKKIIAALPPKIISKEVKAIHNELKKFNGSTSMKEARDILFACAPYLVAIKEKMGPNEVAYIEISTLLANVLLNFTITKFNEVVNEQLEYNIKTDRNGTCFKLMWVLRFSWHIIGNIEKLDTSKEFVQNRLQPNKKNISEVISQLEGWGSRGDFATSFIEKYCTTLQITNPLVRTGSNWFHSRYGFDDLIYGFDNRHKSFTTSGFMSASESDGFIDLRTEEDYYNECKAQFQKRIIAKCYDTYLEKFPQGKYSEQVRQFKQITTEDDCYNKCNEQFQKRAKTGQYDIYLEKFPQGKYFRQVRQFKQITDDEYNNYTQSKASLETCYEYLRKYPSGWYTEEIRSIIDDLEFKRCKSSKDFKSYAAKFSNGKHIQEARMIIKNKKSNRLMIVTLLLITFLSVIVIFIGDSH